MRVAIAGATGAVGQEFLDLLAERSFPITEMKLYASPRSAGKTVTFAGQEVTVQTLPDSGNLDADVVFSSAGGSVSKAHAWNWAQHGAVVIDNTSAWRMDERAPARYSRNQRRGSLAASRGYRQPELLHHHRANGLSTSSPCLWINESNRGNLSSRVRSRGSRL